MGRETLSSLLVVSFALLACGAGRDRSSVIATANGIEVRRAEFERFLALKMGELTGLELPDSIRSQMLDEYIKRRLVINEATRANISITGAEVEQAAADNPQMKSSASGDDTRKEFANDLLIAKYYRQVVLADVRVSTEEVQQYLDRNRERLTDRPGFYVREIRVETQEEADRLRREVSEGKGDFAEMARLHSQAPSAEQGGLARYSEGQLPAVLDKTIRVLNPGDVSAVVHSSFGYHIFKLERRVQAHAPGERRAQLDERRSELIEELIGRKNQQAVDEAVERILSAANIKIDDSTLGFTYVGRLRHN